MIRLYDVLPTAIEFDGVTYAYNPCFDNVLAAYDQLGNDKLVGLDKPAVFFAILEFRPMPAGTVQQFIGLIKAVSSQLQTSSEDAVEYDVLGNPIEMPPSKTERHFSFTQDAGYIYAAFRQAYGIDLFREQGRLHWLEFMTLFNGLPDNTVFRQIVELRAKDPGEIKDKKARAQLIEQQKQYALHEEGSDS